MLLILLIALVISAILVTYMTFYDTHHCKFPRILHLMYIPWDKNQQLKANYNDFDKTFAEKFAKEHSDWQIKLWTYTELESFVTTYYPHYWSFIWSTTVRPVQAIDFFRLLVVYHYGGIYWQYGSTSKRGASLENLIPKHEDQVILLKEVELSNEEAVANGNMYTIRNGKPEENVRVATQVFSAYPRHPFLLYCIQKSCRNIETYTVKEDYDILYIGGNAMMSEAYHECILDTYTSKQLYLLNNDYVTFSSHGSWRTNP